ncbi:MAG: GlxA family transcriptional regulator [Pseudomonadales bacterium]
MDIEISIARFDDALNSAVYGVAELANIANGVAALLGKETSFTCETIDFAAGAMPEHSAIGDVLFLPPIAQGPGCEAQMLETHAHIIEWLKTYKAPDKTVCASCTAVLLLAEAGLLNSCRATTTWWLIKYIVERYPSIDVQENSMLVADKSIITSSGPYSYIYIVLQLVEQFLGPDASALCAKIAVVEPGRPVNGVFAVPSLFAQPDPLLTRAQELIARDLANGVTVCSLAQELGLSERTFHRRVKELAGMSPIQMIAATRIEVAKTLLETSSKPIATISRLVGFEEVSSLRSAFSKTVGMTPSAYRARMNPKSTANF